MKKLIIVIVLTWISNLSLSAQLTEIWKFETKGRIYASVITDGEILFVGSGDGIFYALDKTTGQLKWSYKTAGTKCSTAAIAGNLVYFGTDEGCLYALEKSTGNLQWTLQSSGEKEQDIWDYYLSTPVIHNDTIFWGSGDGSVYALNGQNGNQIWQFTTEGVVHASPVIHDETLYIGSFDGYLYALDVTSGVLKWKFDTLGAQYFPKGAVQKAVLVHNGIVYMGTRDYNLYALDAETGRVFWNYREPKGWIIATPVMYKEHLYFGLSDGHKMCCMDSKTGMLKWTLPLKMRVFGEVGIIDEKLVFGCHDGELYIVDAESGAVITTYSTDGHKENDHIVYNESGEFIEGFQLYGKDYMESEQKILSLGAILSTPLIEKDQIYFTSADGNVYAVRYAR